MIHTTLAASPRRTRVLAAKAIVLGAVTFAVGLAGAAVAVPLGERLARANGVYLFPVTPSAELRVEFGHRGPARRRPRSWRWASAPCSGAALGRSPP